MKLFIQKFLLLPSLLITNIIFLVSNYSVPEPINNAKYSIKHEGKETKIAESSSEKVSIPQKTLYYSKKIDENFSQPNHYSLIISSTNYNLNHKNYISSL